MKLRPFELALVIIFLGLFFFALFRIATIDPDSGEEPTVKEIIGQVTVWGTLPADAVESVLRAEQAENEDFPFIKYKYIHRDQFNAELTNALADQEGPDLIIVSHELLALLENRIQPISYSSFPLPDVRSRYLDGAQIFALNNGLYAYPIAVDPLVMYWNKDILNNSGYLSAPRTWETLTNTIFDDLIQRDFDRTIRRSVVAFGEYSNVRNGFGVISMLLLQGGTQGVQERGDTYQVLVNDSAKGGEPLQSAADFYTRFSRSSNQLYSWNRSFSDDRLRFLGEDLVFYFGYLSEGQTIRKANPNLNFDIAEVPQDANATVRRTYGRFYGVALLQTSDNSSGARRMMSVLGASGIADKLAAANGMVSVYNSTVSAGSNDEFGRVGYQTAPVTYGWLSPDPADADEIFQTMVTDINENRRTAQVSAEDAVRRLQLAY